MTEAKARTWRETPKWMLVPSPNFVLNKIFDEGIFAMIRLKDRTTYFGYVHICHHDGTAILSDVKVITYDRHGKRNAPIKRNYVHVCPKDVVYYGALERCFADCVETLDRICTRSS